jgi:hypothetical protein
VLGGRRIQCIRLANDKRPVSALSCLFACIRKALRNPLGSTTPLRRRDCRAAAVHGLAPQDVKARGDNDRGTEKQARGGHVSPQRESRAG